MCCFAPLKTSTREGRRLSSHIARKVGRQFGENDPGPAGTRPKASLPVNEKCSICWPAAFVYKEIADQLGIGTETVKTYVKKHLQETPCAHTGWKRWRVTATK